MFSFLEFTSQCVCGREGVFLSSTSRMYCEGVFIFTVRKCTASSPSSQSGMGMNRNAHARSSPVPEQENPVRYRTEMLGARIPMLAALVSMPMPSHGHLIYLIKWEVRRFSANLAHASLFFVWQFGSQLGW